MKLIGNVLDPRSASLNYGSGLARGLVCLGLDVGGSYRLLTAGEGSIVPVLQGTGLAVGASPVGQVTNFSTANSLVFDAVATRARLASTLARSWACGVVKLDGAAPSYSRPFGATAEFGASPPFANYDFEINPFASGDLTCWATCNVNGTNITSGGAATAAFPGNLEYVVMGADITAGGNFNLALDGFVVQTQGSVGTPLAYDSTGDGLILNGSDPGSVANSMAGQVPWFAVWDGVALSAAQHLALRDILFDDSSSGLLLVPQVRSYYFGMGFLGVSGSAAMVVPPGAIAAVGTPTVSGVAAIAIPAVADAGAGTPTVNGSGTSVIPPGAWGGFGGSAASITIPSGVWTGSGNVGNGSFAAVVIPPGIFAGIGRTTDFGSAAIVIPPGVWTSFGTVQQPPTPQFNATGFLGSGFPKVNSDFVEGNNDQPGSPRKLTQVWYRLMVTLWNRTVATGAAPEPQDLTQNPTFFTAIGPGQLAASAGQMSLSRDGGDTFHVVAPNGGTIQLLPGDLVQFNWPLDIALPTLVFFPTATGSG